MENKPFEQYFQIPYGTIYIKVVAGTIYYVQTELIKKGKTWEVMEKFNPVIPIEKPC